VNKKGNPSLEMLTILIVIIIFALSFPILYSHLSPVLTGLADNGQMSEEAVSVLENFNTKFPKMLDNMFLIIFIILWVGAIVLSLFIDTHPIFLLISWVLVIIILWSAMFLGNFVEQFINQDAFSLSKDNLPKIYFISSHVLEFMIAIAFSIMLALYGKNRAQGMGGF